MILREFTKTVWTDGALCIETKESVKKRKLFQFLTTLVIKKEQICRKKM